jgi:glycosyltransferase involved in cell wall biosynthesis
MNSTRKILEGGARGKTRKQGKLNLFYMARPPYGGWVSFTAHLALKHDLPLFKVGNKTEEKQREFGYGVKYQNRGANDLPSGKTLITAIDKTCYCHLKAFPNGTYIVIHDPTEVSSKATEPLVQELKRFKILTIRKSVQEYLKEKLNLSSKFLFHPFYEYLFEKSANPKDAVSISRIDFDKHTDILLKANKELSNPIQIYGAHNRMYVHFKLQGLGFKKYYKGQFEKSFEELSKILKDAKYVPDMSVIKHDGGGSQYTFLEAIYQKCALIINEKWVEGFATPFKDKVNCFVVKDENDLVKLLKSDPSVSKINSEAKKLLEPHIQVNWVKAIQSY